MTLAEFLLARINEDEARDPEYGYLLNAPEIDTGIDRAVGSAEEAACNAVQDAWDRRWLAECEAKRRIVGRHDVVDVTGGCAFCGEPAPCEHLRLLALPYADHPDYREEWKP